MTFDNWKLKEVEALVEVVAEDSIEERNALIRRIGLPLKQGEDTGLYRSDTLIEWDRIPGYYNFFFDREGWEERIKKWFERSELAKTPNLIITYGWKEPMVKVPTKLFIEDWEGFVRSTLWETIIFSEDYKLIMEVSRDYYLHSNFKIEGN